MEEIKILKIYISGKKKDGTPFLTKEKKPFEKIAIRVEGGDIPKEAWLSKLLFNRNDPAYALKEGDTVKIKVWQTEENYWNFDFPKPEDEAKEAIDLLIRKVEDHENRLSELESGRGANLVAGIRELKKAEEINPSGLPF